MSRQPLPEADFQVVPTTRSLFGQAPTPIICRSRQRPARLVTPST